MKLILAVIILAFVYFFQKSIYRKYWRKGLETEVSFSRDFIECGESAELIEVVTNNKAMPLPIFHMKFSIDKSLKFAESVNATTTDLYHKNELFSILGHQRITRRHEFTGSARGIVAVNNASILVRDFFMTGSYAMRMDHEDVIYVFPKKISTENFTTYFKGIIGEIEAKRSIVEDALTFRGIREYQPFDSYSSINWKQSAKARELMVNMYGYTTDSRVRIMLNLDNDVMIETNKLLEEAISLASSLARQLLEKGVSVSVISNGNDKDGNLLPGVDEGATKQHGIMIDRMLTEIKGSEGKETFITIVKNEIRAARSNVLYIIISPYARADLMELLDKLNNDKTSIRMLVPCYDEYPYKPERDYAEAWEVPINV